ncbi:MAG: minor capsid protein [Phycisphaerales bacterium]
MTLAAGHHTNLLTGLAVYIAAGGIEATWNTSGVYTALQTGIVLGNFPQSPDRIITLTVYDSDDDYALSDSEVMLQVRTRAEGADKRKVDDLDDAIFNLLQNTCDLVLSTGVTIGQITRVSMGTFGQDTNTPARWSNFSNYSATTWRPSTHRI